LVHARYTPYRWVGEYNGHERSPPVMKNGSRTARRGFNQAALWEAGRSSSLPIHGCRGPAAFANEARAAGGRASPCGRAGAHTARPHERRPRPPCHYRAIHSGLDRSPADNHGQRHSDLDLRRSPPSQVTDRPNPALQAGGRRFESGGPHHQLWLPTDGTTHKRAVIPIL
jgi:hypothetical protein